MHAGGRVLRYPCLPVKLCSAAALVHPRVAPEVLFKRSAKGVIRNNSGRRTALSY